MRALQCLSSSCPGQARVRLGSREGSGVKSRERGTQGSHHITSHPLRCDPVCTQQCTLIMSEHSEEGSTMVGDVREQTANYYFLLGWYLINECLPS